MYRNSNNVFIFIKFIKIYVLGHILVILCSFIIHASKEFKNGDSMFGYTSQKDKSLLQSSYSRYYLLADCYHCCVRFIDEDSSDLDLRFVGESSDLHSAVGLIQTLLLSLVDAKRRIRHR